MAIKTFTTGEVLTAADTNTYLANSGLVFVKSQTVGTGVSTVTVSDAFSATYDSYLIKMDGGVQSTTAQIFIRLGATVSGYKWQLLYGSWNNTPSAEGASGATEIRYAGYGDTTGAVIHLDIMNPFLARSTSTKSFESSNSDGGPAVGLLQNTTSYTAFTILPSGGTITGGQITVYGYRKA